MPEHNSSNDQPGKSPQDEDNMRSLPKSVDPKGGYIAPCNDSENDEPNNESQNDVPIDLEPVFEGNFDASIGREAVDAGVVVVGIVEVDDQEGEEHNKEADGEPEEELVPGADVGIGSVRNAGSQHI